MTETQPSRRSLFTGTKPAATAALALASLAATAQAQTPVAGPNPRARGLSDADILNFALNLEYLETEYYLRALTGQGLQASRAGAAAGPVRGGRQVAFQTPVIREFVENITRNESGHVNFLQSTLGAAAISRPAIDFDAGFAAVSQAAGLGSFDPFASEDDFLLGSFLFEDVGVTAYKGAAPLLRSRDILAAAASIHATEAYHMGAVRSLLFRKGPQSRSRAGRISDLRDQLDGPTELDQGLEANGKANIVPTDSGGIAFSRTPQQVLNIVYGKPGQEVASGAFYPDGVNGRIQTS